MRKILIILFLGLLFSCSNPVAVEPNPEPVEYDYSVTINYPERWYVDIDVEIREGDTFLYPVSNLKITSYTGSSYSYSYTTTEEDLLIRIKIRANLDGTIQTDLGEYIGNFLLTKNNTQEVVTLESANDLSY